MQVIYYVEVNLLCIIILLMLRFSQASNRNKLSADMILFNWLIVVTIVMCASEMVSGVLRGKVFPTARAILGTSNLIYIESLVFVSYLWMVYVDIRLKNAAGNSPAKRLVWAIPLIAFTILALSNPFTDFLFSLDSNNLYSRGSLVFVHWIVSWFYLIAATIKTISRVAHVKDKLKRREIIPLLYFIIAPSLSGLVQTFCYGVSISQVGIMLSIVLLYLLNQRSLILTDALTGLNNRRALDNYIANIASSNEKSQLFMFMLDLDHFKTINDRYGHVAGDLALQKTADILKSLSKGTDSRLYICRFGGDEFLIVAKGCDEEEAQSIKDRICIGFDEASRNRGDFSLHASIGTSEGICSSAEDIQRLIVLADKQMYIAKNTAKQL
ncbi:MAG: diguanylate cyclase [Sphaerochaetaceae bacterium]|nr:diguanylate cyclase [Sphaerochaetaceae bacterium]